MKSILNLLILFVCLEGCSNAIVNPNKLYFRLNQLGYSSTDIKNAAIISDGPIFIKKFKIKTLTSDKNVYEGEITDSTLKYGQFTNCYRFSFSDFSKPGKYYIEVDGQKSFTFSIGDNLYNAVVDSLMQFFRIQRCGPTNPYMHKVCHLSDATSVVGADMQSLDLTGGWHDAGDYIKFFETTAFTTYMLLFSYEFDPVKFGYDNNKNGVPDILEEARVGLDWLLRCKFTKDNIVNQVQDNNDHTVGMRMPENDSLKFSRPAYVSIGKNQVGMFSAVMAIAYRIWTNKFYDNNFAGRCLNEAKELYSFKNKVPNLDKNYSGVYQDQSYWGKLELGAVELYNSTNDKTYLNEAVIFADSAKSDYYWSWGNINSIAHYKLAKILPQYADYIYNNLSSLNNYKNKNLFRESVPYSWGTNHAILGAVLQSILYKNLTRSNEFDSLAQYEKDYILGTNPWGISFIYGIGSKYPMKMHNQIGFFNNGYLPGALAAGGTTESIIKNYKIDRTDTTYNLFNTDSIKYYDDFNDYITNEPTISSNATAVFVFGYYSNR